MEAISYFIQKGESAAIKFVYLNRADHGTDKYNPYDLVVTSHHNVHREHYILTSKGITHIDPETKDGESISLSRWVHESHCFNILRSLTTFKFYMIRKMLHLWHANVRYNKYRRKCDNLAENLLIAQPSFAPAIMQVQTKLAEITSLPLLLLDVRKTCELSDFHSRQQDHIAIIAQEIEKGLEKCQEIMGRACNAVIDKTKRLRQEQVHDSDVWAVRNESLARMRTQQEEKSKELSIAIRQEMMLGDLILLLDYISVESLFIHTVQNYIHFLKFLQKPPIPLGSGLFRCSIFLDDDPNKIIFTPDEKTVLNSFTETRDTLTTAINSLPRFLPLLNFLRLRVRHTNGSGSLARSSQEFDSVTIWIQKVVHKDFVNAVEHTTQLKRYHPLFKYVQRFNKEQFRLESHTFQSLRANVTQIFKWKHDIERIPAPRPVGPLLNVDPKRLRQLLSDGLPVALEAVEGLLIDMGNSMTQSLMAEYKQLTTQMEPRPEKLNRFADFVDLSQHARAGSSDLHERFNVIGKIYALLANPVESRSIPQEHLASVDILKERQIAFDQTLEEAETFVSSNLDSHTLDLERLIIQVMKLGNLFLLNVFSFFFFFFEYISL